MLGPMSAHADEVTEMPKASVWLRLSIPGGLQRFSLIETGYFNRSSTTIMSFNARVISPSMYMAPSTLRTGSL